MPNNIVIGLTKCPKCSDGVIVVRTGAHGKFYGCSNYPDCSWSMDYAEINEELKEVRKQLDEIDLLIQKKQSELREVEKKEYELKSDITNLKKQQYDIVVNNCKHIHKRVETGEKDYGDGMHIVRLVNEKYIVCCDCNTVLKKINAKNI